MANTNGDFVSDAADFNDNVPANADLNSPDAEILDEHQAFDSGGSELLKNVFEAVAQNGTITLDQLPFVLVGAEVQASAKEIEEAIEQLLPNADQADTLFEFHQVEMLYLHLMRNAAAAQQSLQSEQHAPSLWARFLQWRKVRQQRRSMSQTAYEKHMRPTTRLLLVILCTSCVICIAIVVVAIVLIWNFSTDNVLSHIKRDVDLMRNGMNLFAWQKPVQLNAEDSRQLASLVAVMTSELGYKGTKETLKGILDFQCRVMASVLDGWYEYDSRNRVGFSATVVSGWMDLIAQNYNATMAISLLNALNGDLPDGHELVLSRLNATTNQPSFLTSLRYASQCTGRRCLDPSAATATIAALSGKSGTLFGTDYRPAPVAAGFSYAANTSVGVVYKVDQTILRTLFQVPATQLANVANVYAVQLQGGQNSHEELVLATMTANATQILSDVSGCGAACLAKANVSGSPAALATRNQSGVGEAVDFLGNPIVVAYTSLPQSGLGIALSIRRLDFLQDLVPGFAVAIDAANANFNDTKEIQMARFANSTSTGSTGANVTSLALSFYTTPKYPLACGNSSCVVNATTCPYMQLAATQCINGNVESSDYRSNAVLVGFACSADINSAFTVKVDKAQVKSEGIALAKTIAEYQNDVRFKDSTTEFLLAQAKPGLTSMDDAKGFAFLTQLKHLNDCPNAICTGSATHVIRGLQGQTGVLVGPDYRDVQVVGAYTYVHTLGVALVINVESTEAERSSVSVAMQLAGCAVSAVFVGMVFLYLLTNHLLRSMDKAWDEGKRAIEKEKEAFGAVIRAMYPPQVAKRLLAGETHIVYNLPLVSVFFSDIYEFTTASNAISAEELMQFMGYTFGVMDAAAEHFHVHKVKTIGDAYLAVAGLPGNESLTGAVCYDMLLFASSCAQLFSHRYIHPEDGRVLGTVHQALFGRRKPAEAEELARGMPTGIAYGNPALPDATPAAERGPVGQGQCVMRYGVSNGPVTAGILHGKVPLFDIWGKTVNLASCMESTGQPGRIQVSEGVYHSLLKVKGQPFTFDSRHKVFSKSSGHVFAFFLATASVPPPEELLNRLGIEPNLGHFLFENGIPAAVSYAAHDRSSTGKQSTRSSISDGPMAAQSHSRY